MSQQTHIQPPGQILGVAGSGLVRADWAASKFVAKLGRKGEVDTAIVLNEAARTSGGPTVLHHVQPDGSTADVDHILISGRAVHLLDSKVWKPALYWTVGDRHRRSFSLLSHEAAEHMPSSEQMQRARQRVDSVLAAAGVTEFDLIGPILVVWSSSEKKSVNTSMLNLGEGVSVIPGGSLTRVVRRMSKHGTADPRIVAALAAQLDQHSEGGSGQWR